MSDLAGEIDKISAEDVSSHRRHDCNCGECVEGRGGRLKCSTCGFMGSKAEMDLCFQSHLVYQQSARVHEQ